MTALVCLVISACSSTVPSADRPSASAAPSIAGRASDTLSAMSPGPSPDPSPSSRTNSSDAVSSPESTPAESDRSSEPIAGTAGPGCGTGQLGFLTHRGELPDVLRFGGATIEFATAGVGLRNGTFVADDAIPAGLGLSPAEVAVKVAPGTHILLRGDGMVVAETRARVVPWSTVVFSGGLGASPATPVELAERPRTDGSVSVSAPVEPGDYMVGFAPIWRTSCLAGDGSAYSRIKVVRG